MPFSSVLPSLVALYYAVREKPDPGRAVTKLTAISNPVTSGARERPILRA